MRTTVEIEDEHRMRLLQLAARRGDKGFSRIVSEAIEQYLAALDRSEGERRNAMSLRGSLSRAEAERLEARTAEIHRNWR